MQNAYQSMQNVDLQSASAVIDRMREAVGAKNDAALAFHLGVAKATVSSWRQRNSVPYAECLRISNDKGVSLDWLLAGKGERERKGFILPNLDAELLAMAIDLAERWPHKRKKWRASQLAFFIESFYTEVVNRYYSFDRMEKLDRDQIIRSMRKAYGLRKPDFLTWWSKSEEREAREAVWALYRDRNGSDESPN